MAARVTQAALEVLTTGGTGARVAQAVLEVLTTGPDARARVSQAVLEVLERIPSAKGRITQAAIELYLLPGDEPDPPPDVDPLACTIIVDPPDIVHVPLVCTIDIDEGDEGANLCRELNKD